MKKRAMDLDLVYTLTSNVLNSIIELARQSDHRNYLWRVQLSHRIHQLNLFQKQMDGHGIKIELLPGSDTYYLSDIDFDISEGYTNMHFHLCSDDQQFTTRIRDVQAVRAHEAVTISDMHVQIH